MIGKSRYTSHVSLKDFYKYYKDNMIRKNLKPKSYIEYSKLLRDFNKRVREKIIYNSEVFVMPFRLGTLYIRKFEVVRNEDNIKNWSVDYKKTKAEGKVVYFESTYGYRWYWKKKNCIVKGKRFFSFKPCRKSQRLIADAINNKKLDYYN